MNRNSSRRVADLLLFFFSLNSTFFYLWLLPEPLIKGGGETVAIALSLAQSGTYANPLALFKTGPTGVVAPLFPAFLGLLVLFFGKEWPMTALAFTLLAHGLFAALLPRVSDWLFGRSGPGYVGAALAILFPIIRPIPTWEAIWAADGMMLFCLAVSRLNQPEKWTGRTAGMQGTFAGLLLLLHPPALFALMASYWKQLVTHPIAGTLLLRFAAVFLASLGLACSPWAIRNAIVLDSLSIKTNFGMTMRASNNDCAEPSLIEELASGCYLAHHPAGSLPEAELMARVGEGEYDRLRTRDTLAWIAGHPSRFASLTVRRMFFHWFPRLYDGAYTLSLWGVNSVAIAGLLLLLRDDRTAAACLTLLCAAYTLLYSMVVTDPRYLYPFAWISLLCAGYAIEWGWRRLRRRLASRS